MTDSRKESPAQSPRKLRTLSRRGFLRAGGLAGAGAVAASTASFAASPSTALPQLSSIGPLNASEREIEAFQRRFDAAFFQYQKATPVAADNGDDARYSGANYLGSFTKTLPHDALGEVDSAAYQSMLNALSTGAANDFDGVPGGGGTRRLANPRAAFSYSMTGPDGHKVDMPPVHRFDSARQAAEAAEVYWQALLRDVPFDQYGSSALAIEAAADLSAFSDFTGPTEGGSTTPNTLFRGLTPGDAAGPYISQFLYAGIPYGNRRNRQIAFNPAPGQSFMATPADWLAIQNGFAPTQSTAFETTGRFLQTGRDLAEYVHSDYTYQAYLNASLICLSYGGAALDPNPYSLAMREGGFVTFGPAMLWSLIGQAAATALKVSWFHKWLVHRKLRPEAFGGRVHFDATGAADYPIHPEMYQSSVLDKVFAESGNYLLTQAFPEGSPTHPSYPAGHAVIAGAGVTVLKAFFDEDFVIPNAVQPTESGGGLRGYRTEELTLGGELDKLASNIAIGRNIAGVHWRADGDDGLVAGQEAAILMLQDICREVVEDDAGFTLRRFNGETVRITEDAITAL